VTVDLKTRVDLQDAKQSKEKTMKVWKDFLQVNLVMV